MWWTESLDDFRKELRKKKEKLYKGVTGVSNGKEGDRFYFCDFSAKKESDNQEENAAIIQCLKTLREQSRRAKERQDKAVFKKKNKSPIKVNKEVNIYKEDYGYKPQPSETVTLKSFLKDSKRRLGGQFKNGNIKKFASQIRKSSILSKKERQMLEESLRKYLPKGFKKMKKKRNLSPSNKEWMNTKSRIDYSIFSKDERNDSQLKFFKSNNPKLKAKHNIQFATNQKQMKLENLIDKKRKIDTGLDEHYSHGNSTIKDQHSLPKIGFKDKKENSKLDQIKYKFLDHVGTEYDYQGSGRGNAIPGFDVSRLSHGSVMSNGFKKKVSIKARAKGMLVSTKKKSRKKGPRLMGTKAITAKKKQFGSKKIFRSENPHLRTAPDVIRKSNRVKKQIYNTKKIKQASTPKNIINYMRNNKPRTTNKSSKRHENKPSQNRKTKLKQVERTVEGDFGFFDFSGRYNKHNNLAIGLDSVKSFENLGRFVSQNKMRKSGSSKKRLGYSSSSVNKQRSGKLKVKIESERHSAINVNRFKLSKFKANGIPTRNPLKGKKKVFKGLEHKNATHKSRHAKNLTIETYSPKNGFFKQKLLKNLTEKHINKKGFFDEPSQYYQRITKKKTKDFVSSKQVRKSSLITSKSKKNGNKRGTLPSQQVYNHIRMGDSNVKNKFIINIGNVQKGATQPNKVQMTGKV